MFTTVHFPVQVLRKLPHFMELYKEALLACAKKVAESNAAQKMLCGNDFKEYLKHLDKQ